jgi:uncharacterized protein DUF262
MPQMENFLHTTHRTVAWFRKTFLDRELELHAPFQRNPVWTDIQKAYLIDTILNGYPIPELYMQDVSNEDGDEQHIVVDGQQRIRAVLDFLQGTYALEGNEVTRQWRGLRFEDLGAEEKKLVFGYKFVVRILPPMEEEGIRRIFARLNRNVVALNEQELRNATYWGPFITAIQYMADDDPFWAESGIFSANDHRRMLDHEYISELAIAYLHGPQNKKDKLDQYYLLHEERFEDRERLISHFRKVTGEIEGLMPRIATTRWKKKSDFYTLFLCLSEHIGEFPLPGDRRAQVAARIEEFGEKVDVLLRLEEDEWVERDQNLATYARNVARAASDRANRVARADAFSRFVFGETAGAGARI